MSCYLTPIQKVQVIRQSICSIILIQLNLSDHGLKKAQKLKWLIRGALKKILHLPTWKSSDLLHHRHGGNIPDILISIIASRKGTSQKMKISPDPISQYTGNQIDSINIEWRWQLKISNTSTVKNEVRRQREERLSKQNGHFIVTTINSKMSIVQAVMGG